MSVSAAAAPLREKILAQQGAATQVTPRSSSVFMGAEPRAARRLLRLVTRTAARASKKAEDIVAETTAILGALFPCGDDMVP